MESRLNPRQWIWAVLIGTLFILAPGPGYTGGGNLVRTQGLVNPGGNLKAGYLFINEMRIRLDGSTQITDAWGNSIPAMGCVDPCPWVPYLRND